MWLRSQSDVGRWKLYQQLDPRHVLGVVWRQVWELQSFKRCFRDLQEDAQEKEVLQQALRVGAHGPKDSYNGWDRAIK